MRRLRALAAMLALGAGLLMVSVAEPQPAAGVGPLPACRLDDILTEPRGYDDWETTLVDWMLTLGPKYRPTDLVSVGKANVAGGGYVRAVAIDDLRDMAAAARKNGWPIKVLSPFRGYKQQVALFRSYGGENPNRFENAITFSARPGHSEHQTGLTIDFGSIGDTGLTSNWEVTPAGGWMAKNAWKYGWLMSYPKGKQDVVCYRYEPWHYRYVGRDMAKKIHDSGLTIREYLWANYTQVDPACVALPAPTIDPGDDPNPRSCAFAASIPTVAPTLAPTAATGTAGPSPSAARPAATPGPAAEPAAWFGLASITAVGLLVVAGAVALLASLALRRRSRRSHGSRW